MPVEVVFSPESRAQLGELEAYLAERFYAANATRYVQRIIRACLRLGAVPQSGVTRDDLALGLRMTGFEGRVAIYFTTAEDRLLIVSVLYGGKTFLPPYDVDTPT